MKDITAGKTNSISHTTQQKYNFSDQLSHGLRKRKISQKKKQQRHKQDSFLQDTTNIACIRCMKLCHTHWTTCCVTAWGKNTEEMNRTRKSDENVNDNRREWNERQRWYNQWSARQIDHVTVHRITCFEIGISWNLNWLESKSSSEASHKYKNESNKSSVYIVYFTTARQIHDMQSHDKIFY